MIKKADWLNIIKDRTAVLLFLGIAAGCIVILITTSLRIQPSDIQVPVRYTGYGVTLIYRDYWYTQLAYAGFAVTIATINIFLAVKLYQLRRLLGLGWLALSAFLVVIAIIVSNTIFNLAPAL